MRTRNARLARRRAKARENIHPPSCLLIKEPMVNGGAAAECRCPTSGGAQSEGQHSVSVLRSRFRRRLRAGRGVAPVHHQENCRLGVCGIACLPCNCNGSGGGVRKAKAPQSSKERMAMPRGLTAYMVDMVWAVLAGWVSACLLVANEIARGMRAGEIGPFVVG
ncbi:hypothetical protein ACQJBY_038063 [Aegilops geniculata]